MKILEKFTAWRFPCNNEFFNGYYYNIATVNFYGGLYKLKSDLKSKTCSCGKNCKPEKIIITVSKEV